MNHFFLNNVHTKMSALSGRRLSKKGRREKSTITILGLQSRCHWVEMEASRGSPAWVPSSNQGSKHCVLLWAFLAVQAEFLHLKSSPTNYLSVAWCFISPTSQEVGRGKRRRFVFPWLSNSPGKKSSHCLVFCGFWPMAKCRPQQNQKLVGSQNGIVKSRTKL